MQTEVTRKCVIDGSVVGYDHAVAREHDVAEIIINSTHYMGFEDTICSLEPRKKTDLTILDKDPFTVDPS